MRVTSLCYINQRTNGVFPSVTYLVFNSLIISISKGPIGNDMLRVNAIVFL